MSIILWRKNHKTTENRNKCHLKKKKSDLWFHNYSMPSLFCKSTLFWNFIVAFSYKHQFVHSVHILSTIQRLVQWWWKIWSCCKRFNNKLMTLPYYSRWHLRYHTVLNQNIWLISHDEIMKKCPTINVKINDWNPYFGLGNSLPKTILIINTSE